MAETPPSAATSWEALASRYDGFIFDQFGVMHNGAVALDGAPARLGVPSPEERERL